MTSSAIILAAGFGKRMLPLTNAIPKPMVKIKGVPLIQHLIELLDYIDIDQICINVHYKSDLLIDYLDSLNNSKIIISDETNHLLDTGGGIKAAFNLLSNESAFVFNSDIFWEKKYSTQLINMSKKFDSKDMLAFLGLSNLNQIRGYDGFGDFTFLNNDLIERYDNNKSVLYPYVYSGVQIIKKSLLSIIQKKVFSVNMAWDLAIKSNSLYGFRLDNNLKHIGTPEMVDESNNEKN